MPLALLSACLLLIAEPGQVTELAPAPTPTATPPVVTPATTAPANSTAQAAAPEVIAILNAMEQAGKQVQAIRCAVRYTVKDELNLAETQKRGTVLFKRGQPHPMFRVHFAKTFDMVEDLLVGGEEWWLFRDRWLSEAKAKSRHVIKREIVAPGEEVDFFDLQNSRIPMPFGQSQEQILASFTVKLTAPQVGDPENTDHLYCLPKPDVPLAREYKRLDYYVSRDLHLPIRILAVSADETKTTIADFPNLKAGDINPDLPDAAFSLPQETESYHVEIEPREPKPADRQPPHAAD